MCSVSGEFKQEFDLVLVFPVFRTATAFLSIIKYLHTSYSVGILLCRPEGSENQEKKSGQTDNQFLALCRELGADIIEEGPVRSRLVILSYSSYSREYLDALKRKVISDRYWIMHGVLSGNFAMEGIAGFEFEKHLLPDQKFYEWRLSESPEEQAINVPPEKRIEIGTPYKIYPLFDDLEADYLIAVPTLFGMPAIEDRLRFVRTVRDILKKILPGDRGILKPHNAIEEGADAPGHGKLIRLLEKTYIKIFHGLILGLAGLFAPESTQSPDGSNSRLRRLLLEVQIAIHYHVILKRSMLMKDVTPYHNFGLEVFLPGIKKGVITGRSATLWHALHNHLPVFNCVDDEKVNFDIVLKDSLANRIHPKIMEYLAVPYCDGKLDFDEKYFSVIAPSTFAGDLIKLIKEALPAVSTAQNE